MQRKISGKQKLVLKTRKIIKFSLSGYGLLDFIGSVVFAINFRTAN